MTFVRFRKPHRCLKYYSMKKFLSAIIILLVPGLLFAQQQVKTLSAEVYGQSERNTNAKGSALSLESGKSYSLEFIAKRGLYNKIDLLCSFKKSDKEGGFGFFAPDNPLETINFDEKSGTYPYRNFRAGGKDPEGQGWIKKWKVRNATKFQKVDISFEDASADDLSKLQLPDTYQVTGLVAGDVVAFELAATSSHPNEKGLIKILAIKDDPGRADKAGEGAYQQLQLKIKILD